MPDGWSRHLAPSGHYYYYNKSTKVSTYERPNSESKPEVPAPSLPPKPAAAAASTNKTEQPDAKRQKKHNRRPDRPRFKLDLDLEPWVLVFLRSGRWFAHNKETKQSVWKAPPEVQAAIDKVESDDLLILIAKARGLKLKDDKKKTPEPAPAAPEKQRIVIVDEDEDDINAEIEDSDDDAAQQIAEEEPESSEGEDLAWLDEDVPSDDDMDPETKALQFGEMLADHHVNPYNEWDLEYPKVVDDDRYTLYETSKDRKAAFDLWAKDTIAAKQQEPAKPVPSDVRFFLSLPLSYSFTLLTVYRPLFNFCSLSKLIINRNTTLLTSNASSASQLNLRNRGFPTKRKRHCSGHFH